jgi:hypothetical protein
VPAVLAVAAPVVEHVTQGGPHLRERLQIARVVAIREHRAGAADQRVQPPRARALERHHAAAERLLAVRLADQVQVIPLHRVLADPEVVAMSGARERLPHRAVLVAPTKPRDLRQHAQRQMRGRAPIELRARAVLHLRPLRAPLPPGALPLAAPPPEHELLLLHSSHAKTLAHASDIARRADVRFPDNMKGQRSRERRPMRHGAWRHK